MRTCLIFILWGLWASAAAGSLDSLDSQLAKLKQDYAEKESTLTQAQRDLSLVQQRVRDATADLQTAQTELIEEEEAFKFAQSYALRKKMAIDAKAEAEYKAAVNKKELAADNLQRRQRAESEAIAYVQKLQADVQGLSSVVNRVGNDVAVARFEVMREKFEKETEVIFELRFSCGEEVTTKQCREMGRNAADEKAQKLGAVSLLKSVTEADLARLQVTENKVKEELIALVMRRKQLEPEESVKNGEYYGKWSMWVKGQVPESLRPQAGAVLAGGKFSPVMPVSTGQKTIKNSIGMELVLIPAGSFQMGSNEGASDEKPVHQVTISQAFYMGKTEVTQAQWTAVMGNNPSRFKGDDLPVETVSWQDAKAFIQKLNAKENTDKYRLPSEAEWEYAARAGSTTEWYFGGNGSLLGDYAWYYGNSDGKTHAAAGKKPNKYGLYDMAGNVWEWNEDSWEDNYNTPRTQSPYKNSSERHLLRGGSWFYTPLNCRSAYRDNSSSGSNNVGFRIVFLAFS